MGLREPCPLSHAFIWGKLLESHLMEETHSKWPVWRKVLCLYKNSDPKGLSAPALGLYTCIKHEKLCIKSDFKDIFWNLPHMSKVTRLFCWHQDFAHKGCLSLPWGYLHVEKHSKMCIKSEFKEICLKLATNGQNDNGFLLTSKVCPQGVFCPCPGAIYMYKIIKNVYKIRFSKRSFWNLQHVGKEKRPFCCHHNFVPNGYIYGETWKKYI